LTTQLAFNHRHKPVRVELSDDGTLELYVDDCLRKDRVAGKREPQYVWTNLELEWEEHHYVEVRYWGSTQRLQITINREPVLDQIWSLGESSAVTLPG
jgi:hypothetical protein